VTHGFDPRDGAGFNFIQECARRYECDLITAYIKYGHKLKQNQRLDVVKEIISFTSQTEIPALPK